MRETNEFESEKLLGMLLSSLMCGAMVYLDAIKNGRLVTALLIKEEQRRIRQWVSIDEITVSAALMTAGRALVLPLMLKVNDGKRAVYYLTYFNLKDDDGESRRCFKGLGSQPTIPLAFYDEGNKMLFQTEVINPVRKFVDKALALVDYEVEDEGGWTREQFESAKEIVDKNFPTPISLWDELQRINLQGGGAVS